MTPPISPHPITFTDRVRAAFNGTSQSVGMALHRAGIHPDTLTIIGLLIVLIAAVLIGSGNLLAGALVLIFGLPFDALDGAVARAMKRTGKFGALLDSTLDRYADALIFLAVGYYYASVGRLELLAVAGAALVGSFGVSYVRARAESLGVEVKIGLFSRLERVGVMIVALLYPPLLPWGLWLLAIGTNFTTAQRLWYVYKALHDREVH